MRYTDPDVQFSFAGDKEKAHLLIPESRKLLGGLMEYASFNGLGIANRHYRLNDGTTIDVEKWGSIKKIKIFVPKGGGVEYITEVCTGFVVNISLTDPLIYRDSLGNESESKDGLEHYLGLWSYAIEPGLDKDEPTNWMYSIVQVRQGFIWDQDQFTPANEYGFHERPAGHFNGKDIALGGSWDSSAMNNGEHGARIANIDPGCTTWESVNLYTHPCVTSITEEGAGELDAIWGSYPFDVDYDMQQWIAPSVNFGTCQATENYFIGCGGNIITVEGGYAIESGGVLLGATNPYITETSEPLFESGIDKVAFALLPAGTGFSVQNATGHYVVSVVNPLGYDTSESSVQPGVGQDFVFYQTLTETGHVEYRQAEMPTNALSGDYEFKLETRWIDKSNSLEEAVDGKKVSVKIKLLGLRYSPDYYEFEAITGEKNDKFKIKVNQPITVLKENVSQLAGAFIELN